MSLLKTLKSSNLVNEWHLTVNVAKVKERMVKKEIQSEWIRGREHVADCLTKAFTPLLIF